MVSLLHSCHFILLDVKTKFLGNMKHPLLKTFRTNKLFKRLKQPTNVDKMDVSDDLF